MSNSMSRYPSHCQGQCQRPCVTPYNPILTTPSRHPPSQEYGSPSRYHLHPLRISVDHPSLAQTAPPSIPSTITYPHHTPTSDRFSLLSTLPSNFQIDIERDGISRASGQTSNPRLSQFRPPQQRHQLNQLTAPLSPMRRNGSPPSESFETTSAPVPTRSSRPTEPHHPSSSAPPSAKHNSGSHPPPRPASESNIKPSTPYHHTKKDPRLLLGDLRRLLRPPCITSSATTSTWTTS